jgi:hypothetical protein
MRLKEMAIKKWEFLIVWGEHLFRRFYLEKDGQGKVGRKLITKFM